jgi:hypothetical protein
MSNSIVNFLEGIGTDSKNRHLDAILDEDDRYWEHTHDFIQWLFPLNEESRAVRNSPVLIDEEIELIRSSERAQEGLRSATARYQSFLLNTKPWKNSHNHNHLRITRVIKSLRLLSNDDAANGFKYWVAGQLGDRIDTINSESKRFWRNA